MRERFGKYLGEETVGQSTRRVSKFGFGRGRREEREGLTGATVRRNLSPHFPAMCACICGCRLLVELSNTRDGLTSKGRHLQFTRVAFSHHGNELVAGDQQGNVFCFDIARNR